MMSAGQLPKQDAIENCNRQAFYNAGKKRPLSPQGSLVFQELQEELHMRRSRKKERLLQEECEIIDIECNAIMTSQECPFDIDNSNDLIRQKKIRGRSLSGSSSSSSSSSDSSFMFERRLFITTSNGGHSHHKQSSRINVKYANGDRYWHQPPLLHSGFPVNLTSEPSDIVHDMPSDDIHTFAFEYDGKLFYVEAPNVADKELLLKESTSEIDDPTSDRRCFKHVMDPRSGDKFLLLPVGNQNICVGFEEVDIGGGRTDYVMKTVKIGKDSPKWILEPVN